MTHVYIKSDVKKIATTAMTAAANKGCMGVYMKTSIWWGGNDTSDRRGCTFVDEDFSGWGNEQTSCYWWIFFLSQ